MNPMVVSIIIMALCIVLFITEKIPYAVAGLLGLVLLVLFKICSFTEAFGAFAEETFFICFGMVIVGSGLDHSGLLSLIGDRVVRAAGNNTRKLLVICVFMAAILSAFLSNSTIVVLVVTLVAGICKQVRGISMRDLAMPIDTPENMGRKAGLLREQGFTGIKMKVGLNPPEDIERVRAVRAATGSDTLIDVDVNGAYSPKDAIYVLKRIADCGNIIVEQPVDRDDLSGMALVRKAVDVPIGACEAALSQQQIMRVIKYEAADFLTLKCLAHADFSLRSNVCG